MKWQNFYPDNHCFFITSTVNRRLPILIEREVITIFVKNMLVAKQLFGFRLFAYVIMPDHWHLLCFFESGQICRAFNRDFKRFSSHEIINLFKMQNNSDRLAIFQKYANGKVKYSVWKEQARVIPLFNEGKIRRKIDYIHMNPVRAGLVAAQENYEFSSALFCLEGKKGLLEIDEVSFIF